MYLDRDDGEVVVDVVDDGVGLPRGFSLEHSAGLGLSIVQALVTTELERQDRAVGRAGHAGAPHDPDPPGRDRNPLIRHADSAREPGAAPAWLQLAYILWLASQDLRSFRRSSSVMPPQMPAS